MSTERRVIEFVNVSIKLLGNVLQFSGVNCAQDVSFMSMGLSKSVVVSDVDSLRRIKRRG